MGHPPIPATLVQPTFHTFSCKTWRTVYMRTKKVGSSRRVTLLTLSSFCDGWVTLLAGSTFLHINTFGSAIPRFNSVKVRRSERARVRLAQAKGTAFFSYRPPCLAVWCFEWEGVFCCVEFPCGTVLGTLSLLSLVFTKLRRKLSQNSSLKQTHSAVRANYDPVFKGTLKWLIARGNVTQICHFRVTSSLCIKKRLNTKQLWKWFLFSCK